MERRTILTIPEPCSETWNNMTPVQGGSFCSSCQKTVTDFTNMTDDELITFLQKKPASVCGRFRPEQLKTYIVPEQMGFRSRYTLLKAGLLGAFFLLTSKPASAQTTPAKPQSSVSHNASQQKQRESADARPRTIEGTVTDSETGEPMPGANVVVKNSESGTTTDASGRFSMDNLRAGDTLVFSFIGYQSKAYTIPANASSSNIALKLCMDLDTTVLGGVALNEAYNEPTSALGRVWARVKSIF
jgi:hypothetical protein